MKKLGLIGGVGPESTVEGPRRTRLFPADHD